MTIKKILINLLIVSTITLGIFIVYIIYLNIYPPPSKTLPERVENAIMYLE